MKNVKRVFAIIGIVLMLSLVAFALYAAIFSPKGNPALFLTAVFAMVIFPILLYAFIAVYRYVHRDDKKEKNKDNK